MPRKFLKYLIIKQRDPGVNLLQKYKKSEVFHIKFLYFVSKSKWFREHF